ncbi:MAG TPA: thiamine pyrophosphate-dependent enzyme [Thermomicrobiaceae bacterium]|nr:thiamine pyrophosphate-dependent enzyme [Thermomicrobiaceae bacterium]
MAMTLTRPPRDEALAVPAAPPRELERLDLTRRLIRLLNHDEAVVAGIGNSSFDLFGAGHRPQNFYMLGSMGMAVPLGLGLAVAQPARQVLVLEGDGSLLMNLGGLATVGVVAPPNLTIVAWDNGGYQMTGNQPTAAAETTDLVAVARSAGIAHTAWACDEQHFETLVRAALDYPGPAFIGARIRSQASQSHPELDPVVLKYRFMLGIGARTAQERDA